MINNNYETIGLEEIKQDYGIEAVNSACEFIIAHEKKANYNSITYVMDYGEFSIFVCGYKDRESQIIMMKNKPISE